MGKEKFVMWIVGMLLDRLSSEELKGWAKVGLDILEAKVLDTPNKWDDLTVLPMIKLAREAFGLE